MRMKRLKDQINRKRMNILSFRRKLKIFATVPPTDIAHLKPAYKCTKRWYANSYGGFYIHPGLLHEDSIIYSFGIGKDISFDKRMMKNHQCQIFAFDPTPKSISYIGNLPPDPRFHFFDFGISDISGTERFFLPKNKKGVSGSMTFSHVLDQEDHLEVRMKSLWDIMQELGHDRIDVLKMDIEGSEYRVLKSITETDIPVVQLLVEFHDRFFDGEIRSKQTVELLKDKGYEIFAASLSYEEISFINTKYVHENETPDSPP